MSHHNIRPLSDEQCTHRHTIIDYNFIFCKLFVRSTWCIVYISSIELLIVCPKGVDNNYGWEDLKWGGGGGT